MIKQSFVFILIAASSLALSACKHDESPQKQTMAVKMSPTYNTLYFSGNLLPYQITNITAPTDGSVGAMNFQYGQQIKKGQPLFTLESGKLRKDFETTLTAYLKAKEDYNHQSSTYKNTAQLYKSQLVSRDEYTQARSSFYLSELSLIQAQMALKTAAKYSNAQKNIFNLSIDDIKEITQTLTQGKAIANIPISAPTSGIALFPTKALSSSGNDSSGSGDGSSDGKLRVGSTVKQGQLLLSIGTATGLSLQAQANEIEINNLKPGMKADVTSVAFPGITLEGEISSVDFQASSSGSLPNFNITIDIKSIPAKARPLIRIGMSAKAAVKIKGPDEIQVPIEAVHQNPKTGDSMITVVDSSGKKVETPVQAGKTGIDTVVIQSGLKPGETIEY